MCDIGCLICFCFCGLLNFFFLKRFSIIDGYDSGIRIKLCCRVYIDEGRGIKLCFILSKIWVLLLVVVFCFIFFFLILIF